MTAVDTNVLFYVHDFRDVRKQQLAAALLPSIKDGALLWQVACEYLWASRKLQPQGYSYADAVADINELRTAWEPILPAWSVIDSLGDLKKTYGFSHWDSLLVGTCIARGVKILFSEDFGELNRVGPIEIQNPFRTS